MEKFENLHRYTDEQIFKIIVQVGVAVIALSVTYYTNQYFTDFELWFLACGWVALLGSIVSTVLSYFYLREYAKLKVENKMTGENEKKLEWRFSATDSVAVWSFVVGIVIVTIAVMINAIAHNVPEEHIEYYRKVSEQVVSTTTYYQQ